jgi:hypothetical protein
VECIIIHLLKPTKFAAQGMNTNVNYGLWVVMKWQYRLSRFNKYTILEWEVDSGSCCGGGMVGRIWDSMGTLCTFAKLFWEPKLL